METLFRGCQTYLNIDQRELGIKSPHLDSRWNDH